MKLKVIFLFTVLLTTAHCSKSGGGSSARSESTQEQALTGSIAAMSSLGATDTLFSLNKKTRNTSTFCGGEATPKDTSNTPDWAFDKFICAAAHNTYSPDSALGAMTLMKGIVCTAAIQGVTYTASGSTATIPAGTAFSTTCFPQAMLDVFAEEGITSLSGDVTGFSLSTGWDFKLEFRNMAPIEDFDIYIRNSGNVLAAAFINTESGSGDAWTVTVDTRGTPSKIIYSAANQNRHIRMMAEGTISTAGEVTAVTNMAAVMAENNNDDEYVALLGNETDGVAMNFKKNGEGEETGECYKFGNGALVCAGSAPNFSEMNVQPFATALTAQTALFDNNPISMSVSAFSVTKEDAALHNSTLR